MLHIPGLYILDTGDKGRGVFTSEALSPSDMIEICPIIRIPKGQLINVDPTIFYEYYFLWEEEGYEACVALGYGSLYNHSEHPNAIVIMDYEDGTIKIEAHKEIASGSEIIIDYTGGTKGEVELWF
ncbi:MAG: SET domain-containing protein [Saprospiraceae bacterium]|jgi:SET domain-containing protein